MTSTVTAGLDGSAQSLTAVRWAATEASLRRVPLKLVNRRTANRHRTETGRRTGRSSLASPRTPPTTN